MARFLILAAAGLVALTLGFALLGPHSARASGVQGDANCDQRITIDDAFAILNQSAGLAPNAGCIYNGDTTCDGHYTADDVLRVLAYLAGAPLPSIAGCTPVGAPYQITPTPSPTSAVSPPPGPTFTPTPAPSATPTVAPTPTPTMPPPTHTPAPNQTPRTSGDPACQVFPSDNPWNTDISQAPLDANSDNYVDFIGRYTHLHPDFGRRQPARSADQLLLRRRVRPRPLPHSARRPD